MPLKHISNEIEKGSGLLQNGENNYTKQKEKDSDEHSGDHKAMGVTEKESHR